MTLWWLSFTLAGEPRLVLDEPAWLPASGTQWTDDGVTVDAQRGYLFRVLLDDEPAGVIFVGSGQATFSVPETADRFRLASVFHDDDRDLRPLLDDGTWRQALDIALVIDPDAPDLLQDLEQVVVQGRSSGYVDDNGVYQIVVTGVRVSEARRTAKAAIHERREALRDVALDPVGATRLERLEPAGRSLIDVHTDRSWRDAVPYGVRGRRTQWLTWVRDPTGLVNDSYVSQVVATAPSQGDPKQVVSSRLAGARHALGDPAGVRFERAIANVLFTPRSRSVQVDVDVRLFIASDRDSQILPLWLPNPPQERAPGTLPQADGFAITTVMQDGHVVERLDIDGFGARPDEAWVGGLYRLPNPLAAGGRSAVQVTTHDEVTVLHHQDTVSMLDAWRLERNLNPCPLGGPYLCGLASVPQCTCESGEQKVVPPEIPLGMSTQPRLVLPRRPGQTQPYRAEVRAGVHGKRLEVVVSGGTSLKREKDRWWGTTALHDTTVAVGTWSVDRNGPKGPMPELTIYRKGAPSKDAARLLQGILAFYDPALPRFPWLRMSLVTGPSRLSMPFLDVNAIARPTAEAYPGIVHIRPIQEFPLERTGTVNTIASEFPMGLQRDIAHAVAAQWWQGQDVAQADAWIPTTLPRVYRDLYLLHVADDKTVARWNVRRAEQLADLPDAPYALDGSAYDEARSEQLAWLFTGMVRRRIGQPEMLKGFHDALVAGGPLTTDGLRRALEASSGQDLSDIFDVWLAGIRPEIRVQLDAVEGGTRVRATSNLDFATLQLPMGAPDGIWWLEVVDGVGEATRPYPPNKVVADPEGWLPVPVKGG